MKNQDMISVARCRYVRSSAQKLRLVADGIRGQTVVRALNVLTFANKKASKIIKKVLLSAVANSKHNFNSEVKNLRIIKIFVDVGPSLKRIMPRAKGRFDHILKRTSHITIVLSDSLIN